NQHLAGEELSDFRAPGQAAVPKRVLQLVQLGELRAARAAAQQPEHRPHSDGRRASHRAVRVALRILRSGGKMVTRREVLQSAAVLTGAAAFGAAAPLAAEAGWFDKPMRWAQLNSTEDDASEMDIPFWMDYFKRIHADALCITAGGVVAFYPTKIKYHRPSQWLSKRPDYFSQVLEGCKKLGMI